MKLRFLLIGIALGALIFVGIVQLFPIKKYPQQVQAVAGELTISGTSGDFTGNITGGRFVDQANSAYFLDPAATGTSLYTAGAATVSGTIESTTGGFKFPDGTTQTSAGTTLNTIHYNSEASWQTWFTPYRSGMELSYGSTTTVNISAGSIRLNGTTYSFTTSATYGNAVNGVITPTQTMGQAYAVCAEEVTGALQVNMYKLMEDTPATDIYKWDEAGYFLGDHNTTGRCRPSDSNHTSILLGYASIGKTYAASGTGTEVLRYSVVNSDHLNGKLLPPGIPTPNMVFVPGQTLAMDLYEAQVCAQAAALSTSDRCSSTDWGDADGNAHSGNVVAARNKYNVFPSRGNGDWANGLTYHDFLWAGETVGKRLPRDAEWSHAAQYGLTRSLATGTTANMPKGNNGAGGDYDGTDPEETGATTANRDIYNTLGLADLNGNLWEYVDDELYWGSEGTRTSQFGSDYQHGGVVVRGGDWATTTAAGVFARSDSWATYGYTGIGARLAR